MDAQELFTGDLTIEPMENISDPSSEWVRVNDLCGYAIYYDAAREENQFELQSERCDPLRFFVGFFWAVCFSLVIWSVLALIIYGLFRLVANG